MALKATVVVIPRCRQQLLSFRCDLEAGHDGFHHDSTTRALVCAHWPPKIPPQSEGKAPGATKLSANCGGSTAVQRQRA